MDKNGWKVGQAKQQFSEVLRRSESVPQLIYRRNRLIAAVVAMDETGEKPTSRPLTIGDRLDEARELFQSANYELPVPRHRSRANDFVRTLDEVARRHKRRK